MDLLWTCCRLVVHICLYDRLTNTSTILAKRDAIIDVLAVCCTADVTCHWHAGQSSLVAFFWAHPVQAYDDVVSVTAWSRPTVLIRRPSSLGGYPVAATSAVRVCAAARHAAHPSSDCWRPSVRCCRSDALEQSATRHYWLCVTDIIPPETEHYFVFYIIPMNTFFSF